MVINDETAQGMHSSNLNWVRPSPHQHEVTAFLQKQFGVLQWQFDLPRGWGKETYIVHGNGQAYFVKLGAPLANYLAMATLGLTPPIIATGSLGDGTTLLVQPCIDGRKPSWSDFRQFAEQMAGIVRLMQHSAEIRDALPAALSEQYRELGLEALRHVRQKWEFRKKQVLTVAGEVDENLDYLAGQIAGLDGSGTVASHNDICNANWIIARDGQIYLLDLDAMSMDDPAHDLGALLWWYYPPDLRPYFLDIAGYRNDELLRMRMRLRMAIHCLEILLPRENSYDHFEADNFGEMLSDFRAIIAGRENPQGYGGDSAGLQAHR